MTKALNEHLKEVEQKRGRVTELEQSIKDNEIQLLELDENYKNAVINDNSNIEDLFYKMETLRDKIKADKHKLSTLKTVTDEHLKNNAIHVLNTYHNDVSDFYKSKVDEVNEKIKQAKSNYIREVVAYQKEVAGINNKKNAITKKYGQIMKSHDARNGITNNTLGLELDDATYGTYKNIPGEVATVLISDIEGVK